MVNKKGAMLLDLIMVLVIIFAFALVVLFMQTVFTQYKVALDENDHVESDVHERVLRETTTVLDRMDTIFAFMIVGSILALIVSAFYIRTHPVFFVVSVISLIIILMLAGIFSNIFTEISTAEGMTNATANYSIIPNIMDNLPLWMLMIGAMIIIALYAKIKNEVG